MVAVDVLDNSSPYLSSPNRAALVSVTNANVSALIAPMFTMLGRSGVPTGRASVARQLHVEVHGQRRSRASRVEEERVE